MSDKIDELAKQYQENVSCEHPRSIGLFTIPEYPEYEPKRGMWSAAFEAILTTLRYLAPATLLTLFWGQQSFLFKILKYIDSAFRAIVFSSEEQKQAVLQWLAEAGPARVEHLDTVWRHGWILCGVLDAALPGACAGHPPTRLSLKHAQAIADHYLGVEPVFSRQELESNDSLCRHQEWKLATYLNRIRQALAKLTPPISKTTCQRTLPETTQFTMDYVVKGSGLSAAQINNKSFFKIYPTTQQTLDPGEITILIRGPKDTYGLTVLPPVLGKAQIIRQNLLRLQSKQNYTENILPITQGAAYLRSYGKNNMNKTYYIPKTKYDIEITAESHQDHVKICYVVNLEGKYEVSITSKGQNIIGSPFIVTASHSIIRILEKENCCLEDGEEIDIVDVKTDRKVVLRIVDFVTEKMLLKENGALEKITEDEAKILMSTDAEKKRLSSDCKTFNYTSNVNDHKKLKNKKFNDVAHKILRINRVCKIFNDLMIKKRTLSIKKGNTYSQPRTQQDIPDIVNSTFGDMINPKLQAKMDPFVKPEKRDKFIVPENLSVSICSEKPKALYEEEISNATIGIDKAVSDISECSRRSTSPNSFKQVYEGLIDDDFSVYRRTPSNNNNPFLTNVCEENYTTENNLGAFVTTEYETNNSQNEETQESAIKIFVERNVTSSPNSNNPFIDANIVELDRPKTPVYKIISGEFINRNDSVYVKPNTELIPEDMLSNEFINPFFMHHIQSNRHHEQPPITDFIIGAPVSLPPILRPSSPEPVHSLNALTSEYLNKNKIKETTKEPDNKEYKNVNKRKDNSAASSTLQSFESNLTENIEKSHTSTNSDSQFKAYRIEELQYDQAKKDIWDSAYVSIDDNNVSPDSNNNENATLYESLSKQRFSSSDDMYRSKQDISKMGPAEREIWQTCSELNNANKPSEDVNLQKWDIKRHAFTPIAEETERSILSGTKDFTQSETSIKQSDADPVTVAFAELNYMFCEYYSNTESSFINTANEDDNVSNIRIENTVDTNGRSVDSASEILSDVMRHETEIEGMISEVQANVTESVSVSQPLQDTYKQLFDSYNKQNSGETQFGDNKSSNIVLERKKYWDEKIRQIEAKSEDSIHQKKRRISSKQLKHNDSLSKRRGKQIVKKILNSGAGYDQIKSGEIKSQESTVQVPLLYNKTAERSKSDVKIVENWKKYWDDKLELESEDYDMSCFRASSPRIKENGTSAALNSPINDHDSVLNSKIPAKQELPEEIFKAFETSPKRFFGTSRKHILNKIDTFLGNPIAEKCSSKVTSGAIPDTGLVSSRISLFHNMTNKEPLPWTKRKSKSLHNIYQKNDSVRIITSVEDGALAEQAKNIMQPEIHASIQNILNASQGASTVEKVEDNISLKDKRARMVEQKCKSFDEIDYTQPPGHKHFENPKLHLKGTVHTLNKEISHFDKYKNNDILRRTSISKSEMDIFNKVPNQSDDSLDKYKSCDELPKINVKSFISLYETVSKSAMNSKPDFRGMYRTSSTDKSKQSQTITTTLDAENKLNTQHKKTFSESGRCNTVSPEAKNYVNGSFDAVSIKSVDAKTDFNSIDIEIIPKEEKETTYLSLSDIELEIVENVQESERVQGESSIDSSPEHINYKNRFNMAKKYFQSLEELREFKKPLKLNECELLLLNTSNESLENDRPQKRVKKKTKSHSMPSSEISKVWDQMQKNQNQPDSGSSSTKLIKISEKFNIDDLFNDVMEGKLSRQGSLRGIPHKKAVLETFRSMENIADGKISPYEFATSQLCDFAKENKMKNAQTYLTEYPYLPTTDPSKYHSRLDTKASGLISFKELLEKKGRRNSVPDLRLNPKFSVDL